jgi:hypothetical protein
MTDPEDVTQVRKSDLIEVQVDETPDDVRPLPIEADPADVSDQRIEIPLPDDDAEDDF